MPALDWLARDAAHLIAQAVLTRVLRPHATGAEHGDTRSGNLLIQGDNLDALKALLPFYRGRVKCVGERVPPAAEPPVDFVLT